MVPWGVYTSPDLNDLATIHSQLSSVLIKVGLHTTALPSKPNNWGRSETYCWQLYTCKGLRIVFTATVNGIPLLLHGPSVPCTKTLRLGHFSTSTILNPMQTWAPCVPRCWVHLHGGLWTGSRCLVITRSSWQAPSVSGQETWQTVSWNYKIIRVIYRKV